MAKPALRSVKPDEQPTPAQAWLALYRRKVALDAELALVKNGMALNRLAALRALPNVTCGLRDDQLARELERV